MTISVVLKRRRSWLIACALFPVVAFATQVFVFPGNTKLGPQFWKLDAVTVVEALIGVRMLVGLALAEKNWKAWYYLVLPIVVAVVVEWLGRVVLNPPKWMS